MSEKQGPGEEPERSKTGVPPEPLPGSDWPHWMEREVWASEEFIALMLGHDPRCRAYSRWFNWYLHRSWQEDHLGHAQRNALDLVLSSGYHGRKFPPKVWVGWILGKSSVTLPTEMLGLARVMWPEYFAVRSSPQQETGDSGDTPREGVDEDPYGKIARHRRAVVDALVATGNEGEEVDWARLRLPLKEDGYSLEYEGAEQYLVGPDEDGQPGKWPTKHLRVADLRERAARVLAKRKPSGHDG